MCPRFLLQVHATGEVPATGPNSMNTQGVYNH